MVTVDSLGLVQVWIDKDQLASTAQLLIDGYKLPAIGVVDNDHKLIGWVTKHALVGVKSTTRVSEVMTEAPASISVYEPVRDAASELIEREADYLPVTRDGIFHSILTARHMLSTLRESFDPMTELPWSDRLWNWGVQQLEEGVEIAILFIDLDDFGKFNKTYGHVVGDRVIKKVAHHLESLVDPRTDVLVRYGGDEFAIGTSRSREDAEALIETLQGDNEGLAVDGVEEKVTFSIGIYGGRRTKQRTEIHGASNVDNLINLASNDCMARKNALRTPEVEAAPITESSPVATLVEEAPAAAPMVTAVASVPAPKEVPVAIVHDLEVETIQADDEPNSVTYVVLKGQTGLAVGTAAKLGNARADAVAVATAKAIERAYNTAKVEILNLEVIKAGSTELLNLNVRATRDGMEREVQTQAEANGDLDETVCLSVISAYFAE
ncbi:MAG TPA: diguanylate cyclase [Fimbriimonas sp.]|nr:diguanylate cyclase [Fimbriimonas sp.]